jgi:group I intron endonuclease
MNSGIYIIKNTVNNKVYIGKSINIKNRIYNHKSALKSNRHYNTYLQNSYNKYGKDAFIFEVLEKCLEECLSIQEGIWINIFQSHIPNYGYNIEYVNEQGLSNREYDRRTVKKDPKYLLINLQTGEHTFYKQVATIGRILNINNHSRLTDMISNQKRFYNKEKLDRITYKSLILLNISLYYDLNYIKYVYNIYNKNNSYKQEKTKIAKSIKEIPSKKEYIRKGYFKGYPLETYDLKTGSIIENFKNKYEVAEKYNTSTKYIYKVLAGEKKSFKNMGLRYTNPSLVKRFKKK